MNLPHGNLKIKMTLESQGSKENISYFINIRCLVLNPQSPVLFLKEQ